MILNLWSVSFLFLVPVQPVLLVTCFSVLEDFDFHSDVPDLGLKLSYFVTCGIGRLFVNRLAEYIFHSVVS